MNPFISYAIFGCIPVLLANAAEWYILGAVLLVIQVICLVIGFVIER